MAESRRDRAANLWMALEACSSLLEEARDDGVVGDGWTIEELERLADDLTRTYVEETATFPDPRPLS